MGIVPEMLNSQLSEEKNEAVEPFQIFDMESNSIESVDLLGKVVVLDFCGTWCRPCLQEIEELKLIYEQYKNDHDIELFVINTGQGGDTVEKMKAFIDAHDYPFRFGFDLNGGLVEQFELQGVPYLFMIDKKGFLRYEHVGYNKGETLFKENIIKHIEAIR